MSQPHTLTWVNPTLNTDGSALTQAENAGYQINIDGAGAVAIPLAWGTSFDMTSLAAYQALKSGSHSVTLALVTTAGVVGLPSNAATFQIDAIPQAATNLAVS